MPEKQKSDAKSVDWRDFTGSLFTSTVLLT